MTEKTKAESSAIKVLNQRDAKDLTKKSAVEVSKDLQKLMLRMKGEFMAADGDGVNYEELKKSDVFKQYQKQANALATADLDSLSEEEKMAFFINVYNALTIHGLAEHNPLPSSVLELKLFWKNTAYHIGPHIFTLDDIEHGILRGNKPHPAAKEPTLPANDPRLKYVMKKFDPRIHFALNCGAKSCPAINVYSAKNLNTALEAATRAFCQQEVTVHIKLREIALSKIFQWYRSDFGENDVCAIKWAMQYVCEDKQYGIETLLDQLETEGQVDISYREYNWRLNKL